MIHLSANDSVSTYPLNSANDFTSILAKEVRLDELREWEVGVVEIKILPNVENFYICCDFVEPSIVGEYYFPVLRRLLLPTSSMGVEFAYYIDTPFYIKMTRKNLERMRIYLSNEKGLVESVATGLLGVTLDIRERE